MPRKPRPENFSIKFLEGKRIRKVEESETGLSWLITFAAHPDFTISVSARCIFDEHGNFFREDA